MTNQRFSVDQIEEFPDLLSATLSSDQVLATSGDDVLHGLDNQLEYYWDFRQGRWLSRVREQQLVSSADHIDGGAGHDVISTWSGNDVVLGGEGNDVIFAGSGNDLVAGEEGDDRLLGGDGHDVLMGGAGGDILLGGADNDYLNGGDGNDLIDGQTGVDTVHYAANTDNRINLNLRRSQDTGEGFDRLVSVENISSYGGHDVLIGNTASNVLDGGAGHDRLDGGRGDDTLIGGEGNDVLVGGAGQDRLFGGAGLDLAEYLDRSKFDFHAYRTGEQQLTLISDLRGRETDILQDVELLQFRDGTAGFADRTYRNIGGFSVLDWQASGSTVVDSDSLNSDQGLWGRNSSAALHLHKFIGFADRGFDVYDTGPNGSRQPGMKRWSDDVTLFHESIDWLGVSGGAGYAYDFGMKAGVRLDLDGSAGQLNADLNDEVAFTWSRTGDILRLGSSYRNQGSTITVNTPYVDLNLEGIFQSQASFKLKGDIPLDGKGWRYSGDLLPSFLDQNTSLFDLEFDSRESSRPVQLLGNALTMQFEGITLDTDRSYTRDGVMYSVAEDDLFNVNLDVDAAAGMVFGLPNGLSIDFDWSVIEANLTLADLDLTLTASARQEMSVKMDALTGYLLMENGQRVAYTVGQELDLSLATYDVNGDGLIQFATQLHKKATIFNNTDLLVTAEADFSALSGRLDARLGDLGTIGESFGPLINPEPWQLGQLTFDAYDRSWQANLGSVNQQVAVG